MNPRHLARRLLGTAVKTVLLAGLAWAAVLAALWTWQENLLFRPVPISPQIRLSTDADVHERLMEVAGARLSVLELRLPDPKGVVFYLHGNAGNLQTWFVDPEFYRRNNFDLVMMDYRGFGKSSGRIDSEAQLHGDVQAVWDSVAPRYRGRSVVVFGRSLGTGLAAQLATRIQPELTVLVSPYASMQALAGLHYPWVPQAVLRYPLRTDVAVPRLQRPLLLIHGERDSLIPLSHSETLAGLSRQARLARIADAGHNDLQRFDSYKQALTSALQGVGKAE